MSYQILAHLEDTRQPKEDPNCRVCDCPMNWNYMLNKWECPEEDMHDEDYRDLEEDDEWEEDDDLDEIA